MSESASQNFNHLKIHTQYSICEGAVRIDDLQEYSKKNKIKSLGLCDTSNLCGALEFSEKISKSGTQPIIGTQINFKIGDTTGLLPLFALNEAGYKNIIELSSFSYLKNDELSDPHVDFELLLNNSEGVAVFSGTVFGLFGKLFDKGKFTEIDDLYCKIKKTFGDTSKIIVDTYEGLTVDYCSKINANFILRGLRNPADFEFEKTITQVNRRLSKIETVFLLTSAETAFISSSIVREVIVFGGDYRSMVPDAVTVQ